MDSRYPGEGNPRKRTRLMCSLCNEPSLPGKEQLMHFTSAVHRHMKQIKQKQFSYTKNLRTLEEKITASEEQNEPVIGLEYIYQYAADKRGVVPYVCMLCECVYKIDTIFFHIVGVKHRSLYLSKNFPAMGIDGSFRVTTSSEYRKLLSAAEIVEKSQGRKETNVFNTLFNPKKNGGMKYDVESAGEGLSSSDDDGPADRDTLRGGGDHDDRSLSRRGNPPFQGGPPDDGYDGHRGHYNQEDLELSYQQRGPDGRRDFPDDGSTHRGGGPRHHGGPRHGNPPMGLLPPQMDLPGHNRTRIPAPGFPGDRDLQSQMHRGGGAAFQYDRQGPELQGGPRHPDNGFDIRHNENRPREDYDMPPMGPLRDPSDRNPGSRIHRDGKAFQYNDRQGPELQGGPRDFAFMHDENIPSPGNSCADLDLPSVGPFHQTPSFAPEGDPNLHSRMHRDGMAFQYNDRRGPTLPGAPRGTGNQLRNDERGFQRGQSSAHGDPNMLSLGQVHHDDMKSQHRTQIRPPGVLHSQMHGDDGMAFQCDGPRHTGSHVRDNDRRTRWDDPHGDPNMPSLGPSRKHVASDDFRSQPPDFPSDHNLGTPMHRDAFQYGGREGPILHGDPRHADNQFKNNERAFALQHDESPRLLDDAHGDPKMPSMGQEDRSDITGRPPDFSALRNVASRMHRNGMEFRDLQPQMDRRGMAFPYDNIQGEMPRGDLSHSNTFQSDHQRPQLSPRVPSMNSLYQQGDRRGLEERSSAEDRRPHGGVGHDHRGSGDRFLMRGDYISYEELKTAYQSGIGQGHGGLDEQDVTYDSDMEVCSMELSDGDSETFLCNAELFDFLKTFHILTYEDEQFALKVRDMFTSSTIRYKNLREELLRQRIAEEKERLEEEKKAFLEVRRAKERPKKERQKPPGPSRKYAPAPISKPLLPTPTSSNAAMASKPTPLMSILVDPAHPPGAANSLQLSPPGKSRPKGSEQRPPAMPAMDIHSERQSRWDQESLQTEMHLEERFSVPREDLFHSRVPPPRFPPHTGSATY